MALSLVNTADAWTQSNQNLSGVPEWVGWCALLHCCEWEWQSGSVSLDVSSGCGFSDAWEYWIVSWEIGLHIFAAISHSIYQIISRQSSSCSAQTPAIASLVNALCGWPSWSKLCTSQQFLSQNCLSPWRTIYTLITPWPKILTNYQWILLLLQPCATLRT